MTHFVKMNVSILLTIFHLFTLLIRLFRNSDSHFDGLLCVDGLKEYK